MTGGSEPIALRRRSPGLGRGLSALLGDAGGDDNNSLRQVAMSDIQADPAQPRRAFDKAALDELAQSISERGVLQPIIVRAAGNGFRIVAGERRWRAASQAGLQTIPAIVRDFTDRAMLEVALIENIQREDLSAVEEAQAYQRLIDEHGHGVAELGALVNKSRSHIANLIRLLDLPSEILQAVNDGRLTMGHARALINAPDAGAIAGKAIEQGLSVRQVEILAKARKPSRNRNASPSRQHKGTDGDIAMLERQLGDILGLNVTIKHGRAGGHVSLAYGTLEQLDMICQRLSGECI